MAMKSHVGDISMNMHTMHSGIFNVVACFRQSECFSSLSPQDFYPSSEHNECNVICLVLVHNLQCVILL